MKRLSRMAWAVVSIGFLAGCGVAATSSGSSASMNNVAVASTAPAHLENAPTFSLPLLTGKGTITLADLLAKHKPIIINTWASWCGPCQQETPDLVKLSKQYGGQVTFVGINMTSQDKLVDAQNFVRKYKVTYLTLQDPKHIFLDGYNIMGFPTTFVISLSGKLVTTVQGSMTLEQMQSIVAQAVSSP